MSTVLISILCADRTGLVAAIAGRLFDLGADLGDTTFAVLGAGAEFTSVCDLSGAVAAADVEAELRALPELTGARVSVEPFTLGRLHGPSGRVTHRITVSGGDRPGLVARLAEAFVQFKANIVEMSAERVPEESLYVTRFSVWLPQDHAPSCLATIANTAGELGLSCRWKEVGQPLAGA